MKIHFGFASTLTCAAISVFCLSGALTLSTLSGCATSTKAPEKPEAVPVPPAAALPTTIDEAVAGPYRTDSNRARDQYRHPVETLKFFGLKPEMTIVELNPGGGWYMEILAPLMANNGHYIAAMPVGAKHSGDEDMASFESRYPNLASKIEIVNFNPPTHNRIAPDGSVDMILTFRNIHNWMMSGTEKAVFKAAFSALKPGGVLGVVEHRAGPQTKNTAKGMAGYIPEKLVISMAKKAGFKLDQKSDINANPKDKKNYPEGVWTLPPTLHLGDQDRAKYLAIGESDRMTLRFVKPLKK